MRSKLVCRFITAARAIITAATTLLGCIRNPIRTECSLASPQAFLLFSSQSIVKAIPRQTMSRQNQHVARYCLHQSVTWWISAES